ncbi:hypothetical protein HK101_004570, partial [Irineochytrium annulatum]
MLDQFSIITKGGLVLWTRAFADVRPYASSTHPVDSLIRDVLIEERSGLDYYEKDSFRIHWTFANDLGLIFVVVYQKILQLAYIEDLLETVKKAFCDMYAHVVADASRLRDFQFRDTFDVILSELEAREARDKKHRTPRSFQESKKFANTLQGSKAKDAPKSAPPPDPVTASPPLGPSDMASKIRKMQQSKGKKSLPKKEEGSAEGKSKKVMRSWDGSMPQDGGKKLDFSEENASGGDDFDADQWVDRTAMGAKTSDGLYEAAEMDAGDESEDDNIITRIASATAAQPATSGVFSFLKSLTGATTLTKDNLAPVLAKMKEHLITKNVASEIAETLCQSVSTSLVGQKQGSFTSVANTVKGAMEASLRRILTPRTSTDVLRDVMAAKADGRPYSFVFIGVNGVGKSTNLSKVCFWLLQNNLKVLIAACDTFRSGAVEQLRVHARNLRSLESGSVVELYEKGYGKDAAGIAKEAIQYATNTPDKIIFVGEALVGNEAVDQLSKFNQALRDFSGMAVPRQVDGIILTKFDTVDDKVGAALSMTFITGQPILFVGTGQTYTDLKRMNVRGIVSKLLGSLPGLALRAVSPQSVVSHAFAMGEPKPDPAADVAVGGQNAHPTPRTQVKILKKASTTLPAAEEADTKEKEIERDGEKDEPSDAADEADADEVDDVRIMRREKKTSSPTVLAPNPFSSSTSSPATSSPIIIAKSVAAKSSSSSDGEDGDSAKAQAAASKTLAEREAEYRAARMRIFGKEEPDSEGETGNQSLSSLGLNPDSDSFSMTPLSNALPPHPAAHSVNPISNNSAVRPYRSSTPPVRSVANNLDNHPRIWTPSNQVAVNVSNAMGTTAGLWAAPGGGGYGGPLQGLGNGLPGS